MMEDTLPANRILRLDSVGSTNDYAADLANEGNLPEGFVVLAYNQNYGRGHDTNSWESEPGMNLTFSMVLYPRFLPPGRQFILTKVVALAVRETVSQLIPQHTVSIKWPNDIYIDDRKVAGNLIQHSIMGSGIDNTIVGIGLNVNQLEFSSDAPNPVSLRIISGQEYKLDDVLGLLCRNIDKYYELLRSRYFGQIDRAYLEHFYRINIFSNFRKDGLAFEAKITGVSTFGHLMMETREGDFLKFAMKEVEFVL